LQINWFHAPRRQVIQKQKSALKNSKSAIPNPHPNLEENPNFEIDRRR
jgi:hypothetical protein